jgi:hypothetical protein
MTPPTTKQQIRKAVQSMIDSALEDGALTEPKTLVAHVGDQHIAIQLTPESFAKKPKAPKVAEV